MSRSLSVIFVILVSIHISVAQSKINFSSMDVFSMEWVDDPQISPDGSKVVYVRRGMDIMTDKRQSRLWMVNADGTEHSKLTSQDVQESSPRWSPDGSKILFSASTDEGTEIFVYWLKTAKVAKLTSLDSSPKGMVWSPDGKQIAFSMFVEGTELALVQPHQRPKGAKWAASPRVTSRLKHEADGSGYMKPGYSHIFVIPADGGVAKQVTTGSFHHKASPVWESNTTLIISANRSKNWEFEFRNTYLYRIDLNTGKISQLTTRNGPDKSPDVAKNGKIIFLGYEDKKQTYQLTKLSLITNGQVSSVPLELDRSISSPVWDARGNAVYFMFDDHGNTKIGYSSLNGKVDIKAKDLGGTGMGRPYGGGSFSVSDEGVIAYTHTTPAYPAALAIVDESGQTNIVLSLNDDILPSRNLATVEEIWYRSSVDGRAVQGWIAKPPQFVAGKQYPLIVENHGGPISNYGDRFSPEIQLLACAGYVVFYPNPRGSTSYGEEFGNLLYHDYPGDDYHDVMDGVEAVVAKGYIDEDQLFVTGGSAGGIMTAWMIGKSQKFKAAAVVKPVMNWISKTLVADNYYAYADYRYPGQPWENPEIYWHFSPISLVGQIETPTLVMVGTSDMRTPVSEAKQLYHALKLRKVDTALVEIPGAYHLIAKRPSQLITKIEHILAWFDLYAEK